MPIIQMKKIIALTLALILCLSLVACGGENSIPEATEEAETVATPEVSAEETVYKLGDVIETDFFRIIPAFTGYAYELANWPDENFMTPEGQFSGVSAYSANEGKTVMYGEMQIEYIGNEKSTVTLNMDISVNYDDGYIFAGSSVDMGSCVSIDGKWSYDGQMAFEPLSSNNTRILRYCVEVPEQVEANTDKSLLVTFLVNNEPFIYDFRSGDVLGSDYDPRAEFYLPVDETTKAQIIAYLKSNGLEEMGWYDKNVGTYTFTFADTTVEAVLPYMYDSDYQYNFSGTYEVFSGTILLSWDYGEQMHLDYTFDGTTLEIVEFEHGR